MFDLNRLLELKEFCLLIGENNPDVVLTESVWESIELLSRCLEPVYKTTIKLQAEQLTLGVIFMVNG